MKKSLLIIFATILALGFVSCKRANTAAETIVIDSLQTFTDSLLRQKLMMTANCRCFYEEAKQRFFLTEE